MEGHERCFRQAPWRVTVSLAWRWPHHWLYPLAGRGWLRRFPRASKSRRGQRLSASDGGASFDGCHVLAVPLTELSLGRGARLGFGQVQLLGGRAWQLGNQVSWVSRDATLRSMTVALGGDYARVRTDSVLEGAGGDSQLLPPTLVPASRCTTCGPCSIMRRPRRVRTSCSKASWPTKRIPSIPASSVSKRGPRAPMRSQTNRNLVLSEGAQADSVPNLEIEDNDVRCSHASAVGPIDESQRFYLESRGVPPHVAERLIALGFIDDVLERFPVPGSLAWLRQAFASKLKFRRFRRLVEPQPGRWARTWGRSRLKALSEELP